MLQQPFDIALWLITIVLQVVLVCLLVARRHHRDYPAFTIFASIKAVKSLILLSLVGHQAAYYYTYWALMAISSIALLAVLHEIFRHIFQPYETLPKTFIPNLIVTCVFISAVVIAMIGQFPSLNTPSPIENCIRVIDRGWSSVAAALLFIVCTSGRWLGIRMRHQLFGFTTGLALYLVIAAVSAFLFTRVTLAGGMSLQYIDRTAWLFAMVVWCSYAALPPFKKRRPTPEMIAALQRLRDQMLIFNSEWREWAHARRNR